MKPNTCLVLDVWEGSLDIDEATLANAGVVGMCIRLNDIQGGLHKDKNFDNQWKQAANFIKWPYAVYNPWVSAQKNFDWLKANMPAGCKTVSIDIEVKYILKSPKGYAKDILEFMALCKPFWKTIIYTAEWFLPFLASWPTKVDYWWAQYPALLYPSKITNIDWSLLETWLSVFDRPANQGRIPGHLVMWQCSGDRFILPGTAGRVMDINIFYGSAADLAEYINGEAGIPIPEPPPDVDDNFPFVYRIKDDIECGVPPRPYIRVGLPSTVRIWGGKGTIKLTIQWLWYLQQVNSPQAYQYIIKDNSGWHNTGDYNLMQELTFSGNIVLGKVPDEFGHVYIKTYFLTDHIPTIYYRPTENNLHPLVQMFSTQYGEDSNYPHHLDMTTDGRFPRTLIIANPGERLYMNLEDLVRL